MYLTVLNNDSFIHSFPLAAFISYTVHHIYSDPLGEETTGAAHCVIRQKEKEDSRKIRERPIQSCSAGKLVTKCFQYIAGPETEVNFDDSLQTGDSMSMILSSGHVSPQWIPFNHLYPNQPLLDHGTRTYRRFSSCSLYSYVMELTFPVGTLSNAPFAYHRVL